jgi:hypothetical protein
VTIPKPDIQIVEPFDFWTYLRPVLEMTASLDCFMKNGFFEKNGLG